MENGQTLTVSQQGPRKRRHLSGESCGLGLQIRAFGNEYLTLTGPVPASIDRRALYVHTVLHRYNGLCSMSGGVFIMAGWMSLSSFFLKIVQEEVN